MFLSPEKLLWLAFRFRWPTRQRRENKAYAEQQRSR
jgi:hypothetical protein